MHNRYWARTRTRSKPIINVSVSFCFFSLLQINFRNWNNKFFLRIVTLKKIFLLVFLMFRDDHQSNTDRCEASAAVLSLPVAVCCIVSSVTCLLFPPQYLTSDGWLDYYLCLVSLRVTVIGRTKQHRRNKSSNAPNLPYSCRTVKPSGVE